MCSLVFGPRDFDMAFAAQKGRERGDLSVHGNGLDGASVGIVLNLRDRCGDLARQFRDRTKALIAVWANSVEVLYVHLGERKQQPL